MLKQCSSIWDGQLGQTSIAKLRIELLPDPNLVPSAPYQAGPTVREIQRIEIEEMLFHDGTAPVQTEWAATTVFATKKDKSFRFFLNCRKLNSISRRDSYLISRNNECIDSLGEATIFFTLDANSGYRQVKIDEKKR